MMVEGEMKEVSEHDMLEAIKFAHEEIKKHCRVQKELMHELGTDGPKRDYPHDEQDEELRKAVYDFCYDKCYALAKSAKPKHEREDGFTAIKDEFIATIPEPASIEEKEAYDAKVAMAARYYHDVEKEAMRNMILDEGVRLDGRVCNQVRPIWCEVDYLPCAHGSAIFTRGETQSLASVTLGGVFEVTVKGVPIGLGSHIQWDRKLDAKIAMAMMSIQAIKGVEIGAGFECANLFGSQVHDEIFSDLENDIYRETNRAGGIEGGMSNGEDIVIRAVMKPIPTLMKPLRTIDLDNRRQVLACKERSDTCAVEAAAVVGEAMAAFVIAQAMVDRFGGDSLADIELHKNGQSISEDSLLEDF